MGDELSDVSRGLFSAAFGSIGNLLHERKLKNALKKMLTDKRFPKGYRSSDQLIDAIGGDRQLAIKLLIAIGARKSESSDEWTLKQEF